MENPNNIEVTFVDAASGETLFKSLMPPDRLPQSFETSTTFHIQDEDWHVEKAEPMTASEFIQTGRLTIRVRKTITGKINPNKVLLTLPTLNNEIGAIKEGSSKLDKIVLELHEDDWRQIELVSTIYEADIQAELTDINRIYTEESVPSRYMPAFRNLHVRKRIKTPLTPGLTLAELRQVFPDSQECDGVAYERVAGVVENSFAFGVSDALALYGQQTGDNVTVLGLVVNMGAEDSDKQTIIQPLSNLMSAHNLVLVDWIRMEQIVYNTKVLAEYLQIKEK